jgi:hypothetical protein
MSLCPNNPVHFVKNVFFSYNLNYDFCTICKDDISNIAKSKKIQIKRGQLADLNDNKLSIDLRGETNKIPAHLICGIEKSGKSILTHTLIYEHQQSHPDAQVIILTENDLYQNLVIDFHGNYFDDSDAIYFSEVFNGPLSVLNIGKNSSYIDSFISGLMNYATTSRPVDKILFVLDIEKALEKTKDLDTLMMAILYASSYNFCFFWVNSDPFFSDTNITLIRLHLL